MEMNLGVRIKEQLTVCDHPCIILRSASPNAIQRGCSLSCSNSGMLGFGWGLRSYMNLPSQFLPTQGFPNRPSWHQPSLVFATVGGPLTSVTSGLSAKQRTLSALNARTPMASLRCRCERPEGHGPEADTQTQASHLFCYYFSLPDSFLPFSFSRAWGIQG